MRFLKSAYYVSLAIGILTSKSAYAELAQAKPNVYFSGIYGISKDLPIYKKNRATLLRKARTALERMAFDEKNSFNLILSTDAEKSKHDISNPLVLSLIITRDDEQIHEYSTPCCGKFRRTDLNLGIDLIIYQKMQEEGKSKNIVLYSLPINKYLTSLDSIGKNDGDAVAQRMVRLFDSSMCDITNRLKTLELDKIHAKINVSGDEVTLTKGSRDGLRANQSVDITCSEKRIKSKIIKTEENKAFIKTNASTINTRNCLAELYQIKMYDSEIWQIHDIKITSSDAKKLFNEQHLSSQMANWASSTLVSKGLCVLPPSQGNKWIKNSDKTLSMLVAYENGSEEYVYPEPTNSVSIDLSGIANGIIDENSISQQIGYKIWVEFSINGKAHPETTFTSASNVVKDMEVIRNEDQYIDLIHSGISNLFKKEK